MIDQKHTLKKCPACKSGDVTMKAGVFSCGKCGYVNKPTSNEIIVMDEATRYFKPNNHSELSKQMSQIHLSTRRRIILK